MFLNDLYHCGSVLSICIVNYDVFLLLFCYTGEGANKLAVQTNCTALTLDCCKKPFPL